MGRCYAYTHQGDLKSAIADGSRAVEIAPYDEESYHALGIAYWLSNKLDNALQSFQRAYALNDEFTCANAGVALTHYKLHNHSQAFSIWNQLAAKNKNYKDPTSAQELKLWPQPMIESACKLVSEL